MKILLQGGNFKNSFNPQIYFGHIVEKGIPGHEVITLGLHERDQIKWAPEEPFEAILDRLPKGWLPDVYLCQGAEYHLIPRGIEEAPFSIAATVIDYDYHVTSALRFARLFDLIVTYGEAARKDFEGMGAARVISVPDWSGFLPEMFPYPPGPYGERAIDISFAGHIDDINHGDRSRLLFRLAQLPERVKVRIETYLPPEEYGRRLADSRVVFTYHRRGEIQSRLLDAMANGAVGLCPEGGEIGRFFEDRDRPEYFAYTDDRLEEQILSWLDDQIQGGRAAERGRRKAFQEYDSRTALKRLFDAVEREMVNLRPSFARPLAGETEVYYPIKSIYSDNALADWHRWLDGSAARLEAMVASDRSPYLRNELAVCLLALAAGSRDRSESLQRINRAIGVLKECLELHPDYTMAAFNLAWIYTLSGKEEAAITTFRYAAALLESGDGVLDHAASFDIEHNFLPHSFRRIYYDDLLEYVRTRGREPRQRMKNVLASTCWHLAGMSIRRQRCSLSEVLEYLRKAVSLDDRRGSLHHAIGRELHRLGRTVEARESTERALAALPFDPRVARDAASIRLQTGDAVGAREILDRWSLASGRVDLLASYSEFFITARQEPARLLKRPLVSVVIPLYNYGRFITECIRSVLQQTYEPIEVIVVDHGSTDDGPEKVRAFGDRVRFLSCLRDSSAHNTSAPLNMGILAARGEFISWLNADDLFLPEKIERQVDAVIMDDRVGLVYTNYIVEILQGVSPENLKFLHMGLEPDDWDFLAREGRIRGRGTIESYPRHEVLYRLLEGNFIIASTTLIRKAVFEEFGLFDECLPQSQDYAMWLRIISSSWKALRLPEELAVFRIHETNTKSWETMVSEISGVRREAISWPIEVFDPRLGNGSADEDRAAACHRLIHPLVMNGMHVEALEQIERALSLDPGNKRYHDERARLVDILRLGVVPTRAERRRRAREAKHTRGTAINAAAGSRG